jgi:hypothetical protein
MALCVAEVLVDREKPDVQPDAVFSQDNGNGEPLE